MLYGIQEQMRDVIHTTHLRRLENEDIVGIFGSNTTNQFDHARRHNGIPVIIPAHNEEHDLPTTLLSLAQSSEVIPIVVDNNSTDRTAEVAQDMGAILLTTPENYKKMGATQLGMRFAVEELGAKLALATDADTLIPRYWPTNMQHKLKEADQGKGAALFATGVSWHGESKLTDTARSTYRVLRNTRQKFLAGHVSAHGYDYGLSFDADGTVLSTIESLNPEIFMGDDCRIRDALQEQAIPVVGAIGLSTAVISRGDRVTSILHNLPWRETGRKLSYIAEYGEDAIRKVS